MTEERKYQNIFSFIKRFIESTIGIGNNGTYSIANKPGGVLVNCIDFLANW